MEQALLQAEGRAEQEQVEAESEIISQLQLKLSQLDKAIQREKDEVGAPNTEECDTVKHSGTTHWFLHVNVGHVLQSLCVNLKTHLFTNVQTVSIFPLTCTAYTVHVCPETQSAVSSLRCPAVPVFEKTKTVEDFLAGCVSY